jgi:predicted lipoprotein with Yx(FWY)xxD motif
MQRHHTAILSGAIALTSFFAVGAGVAVGTAADAAGAYGAYGSPAVHASSTTKPVIALQGTAKTATVHTATSTVNGKTETILVDSAGLPLYYYPADTAKKSLVSGELARLWPPLLSTHPTASGTLGKLTALKVAAGHQVTYKGHFLYTFIEDSAGHVTGQGVSNFSVATPQLKTISSATKVASTAPASSSSSGGSYSYGY